jgi:putative transposase
MAQYIATANPTIQAGQRYASDCTNKEWTIIAPDLAQTPGPGRKRTVNLRQVVNAIFYRVRTGCQWRMLPQEFPDWRPVWYYYKKWTADGAWERLNDVLRRKLRQPAGKEPDPSLDILDSQSVKTTEAGGERGTDSLASICQTPWATPAWGNGASTGRRLDHKRSPKLRQ